jgi:hypothetical protein
MSARPRGFIADWRQADTLALLNQVMAVLDEYAEQLPLALRQILFRLVGAYLYEKTERAYKRLTEALNKARRARLVPIGAAGRPESEARRTIASGFFRTR